MVSRKVDICHLHVHLDEKWALYLALSYGKKVFEGLETARYVYASPLEKKTPVQWARERTLVIGGGGDITDEHGKGERARIENMSSATLMFDLLKVSCPIVRAMTQEVNYWDNNPGCPKTHWASILKMARTNMTPKDENLVKAWTMEVFSAVHRREAYGLSKHKKEVPFETYIMSMIENNASFTDPDAREALIKMIKNESCAQGTFSFFRLRHVYESLVRVGSDVSLLKPIIELLYVDQVHFHSFRRILRSKDFDGWFEFPVQKGNEIIYVPAASFIDQANNPQAHSAVLAYDRERHHQNVMLSVGKNNMGNVAIFGNNKFAQHKGLEESIDRGLCNLVGMLRFLELRSEIRKKVNWEMICSYGDYFNDIHWYRTPWLSILNGTHNHNTPPTTHGIKTLRELINIAFVPSRVEDWKKRHQVPNMSWVSGVGPQRKFDRLKDVEALFV